VLKFDNEVSVTIHVQASLSNVARSVALRMFGRARGSQVVRLSASILCGTATGGCSSSTAPCDICTTSAVVFGTVVDSASVPLVGVIVDIDVFDGTCTLGNRRGGPYIRTPRTDVHGAYRASVGSLYSPFVASCLIVEVNPNRDPRWPTASFERDGPLELRSDYVNEPRDSIRIDIVIAR
jgi:hypothetical protein